MKLSRQAQYGLLAVAHLAGAPKGSVRMAAALAAELRLSPSFLAKVLQKLAAGAVLRSHRGALRGYSLARPPAEISALEVIVALDPEVFGHCVFWSDRCSEARPCLLHPLWRTVRPQLSDLLGGLSIAELAGKRTLAELRPRLDPQLP